MKTINLYTYIVPVHKHTYNVTKHEGPYRKQYSV